MFFISLMKLIKRTKLELNLNIEFGSVILLAISTSKGKIRNHLSNSMLEKVGQKSQHSMIILSRLKNLYITAGKNCPLPFFIPTRLSYKHPLKLFQQMLIIHGDQINLKFELQDITVHFSNFSTLTEWEIEGHFLTIHVLFQKIIHFREPQFSEHIARNQVEISLIFSLIAYLVRFNTNNKRHFLTYMLTPVSKFTTYDSTTINTENRK